MSPYPSKLILFTNKSLNHGAAFNLIKSLRFATTIFITWPNPAGSVSTTTPSSSSSSTTSRAVLAVFRALATKSSAVPSEPGVVGNGPPGAEADQAHDQQEQQNMMDVVITKIISMLILAVLSVLCGLLPLRMLIHSPNIFSRGGRGPLEYFLCGLRLFSGGIYLATCFLHLMPDTREKMAAVMINMGSNTKYAVPELLVLCGFYAVVFVEQIIQALYVKALQSDANRKRRRPRPPAPRGAREDNRFPRKSRSSPDEESSRGDGDMGDLVTMPNPGNCSNRSSSMRYNVEDNDDDDEDDDDDVLVDEEEDMSFNNSDSDERSLDSMTQAKEKLIDPDTVQEYRRECQTDSRQSGECINSNAVPSATVHVRCNPTHSMNRQDSNSSAADTEVVLLKTFCPVSNSETLPRRSTVPGSQFDCGPPPTIHIHSHQHHPSRHSAEMNHCGQKANIYPHPPNKQYHQQQQNQPTSLPPHLPTSSCQNKLTPNNVNKESPQQNHCSSSPSFSSPSVSSSHIPETLRASEPQRISQPYTTNDTPLAKKSNVQYPVIDKNMDSPRSETHSDPHSPQGELPQSLVYLKEDRAFSNSPCEENDRYHREAFTTISTAAPFTYTPPTTSIGNNYRPKKNDSSSQEDRDVDSGIFSSRRDTQPPNTEARKLNTMAPSREVSFDQISDSSSQLQDIQVKRVVDELSRRDDSSTAHFRSIIYIMALSFHGIFEGMALGLQSMKSSVWALCFAIVVHRCVLAFKLGMDLSRGEEKHGTAFLCIGTFTLISILGIIIGVLICSGASLYSDVTVPEAILQSLATGTIFYIVFFDILFKDLEGKDDLKRVSCSFVGFALMAVVFAITRS
ncbi:zinc transporter ZIP3 [Elysia marginata]|uniref:Zinc transporter ZIP3 n=1 Tax=Elysia marginata TaxID=1093978 RepID=A0AAV4G4A9_9GAST|nr:zinc transporter ZIP3 [Elysia marginata]